MNYLYVCKYVYDKLSYGAERLRKIESQLQYKPMKLDGLPRAQNKSSYLHEHYLDLREQCAQLKEIYWQVGEELENFAWETLKDDLLTDIIVRRYIAFEPFRWIADYWDLPVEKIYKLHQKAVKMLDAEMSSVLKSNLLNYE